MKMDMIQRTVTDWVEVPQFPKNLPSEDGEPLESNWHRLAMNLLIESLGYYLRDRDDIFVGGNMFIYFCEQQIKAQNFRGPDFFFASGVDRYKPREYWAVWEENGKYPNVIIELLSPKTAKIDRTVKKEVYEQTFKTPDYFLYDRLTHALEGWHLQSGAYVALEANERGWLWSEQLGLWIGNWDGQYLEVPDIYPRFFEPDRNLVLIGREAEGLQAATEKQRADAEKLRADSAAAELSSLKARLAEFEGKVDG